MTAAVEKELLQPVDAVLMGAYYLVALYIMGIVVWIVVTSDKFWERVNGALLYIPLLLRVLRMK